MNIAVVVIVVHVVALLDKVAVRLAVNDMVPLVEIEPDDDEVLKGEPVTDAQEVVV